MVSVPGDGLDRHAGGDVAEQRQLDRAAAGAAGQQLHRAAAVPGALDEPLLLEVGQVLVDRGQRRQAEAAADFLQARRVAVLLDELVEVVENLALAFGERLHGASFERLSEETPKPRSDRESKQTKGESQRRATAAVRLPALAHASSTSSPSGENSIDLVAVVDRPSGRRRQASRCASFARAAGRRGGHRGRGAGPSRLPRGLRRPVRRRRLRRAPASRASRGEGVDVRSVVIVPGAASRLAVILVDRDAGTAHRHLATRDPRLSRPARRRAAARMWSADAG